MEESKELQGVYKIFRTAIYVSLLIEFFMYAIDPEVLDYWNGVVCDVHSRIKSWFLYHDGHLVYSKIATFALICITCVGTRNKKHLSSVKRQFFTTNPLVCQKGYFPSKRQLIAMMLLHSFSADSPARIVTSSS